MPTKEEMGKHIERLRLEVRKLRTANKSIVRDEMFIKSSTPIPETLPTNTQELNFEIRKIKKRAARIGGLPLTEPEKTILRAYYSKIEYGLNKIKLESKEKI